MDANVIWNGRLAFSGAADSGFLVPLDGDAEAGGSDSGFRPMELIAIGLAGCTAMDVISILKKKRQEVTAFEVRVHAEQAAEHPHVFTQATVEYFVTGRGVEEAAVRRSIELSATRYCPAQAMLGQVMPISLKYSIFEAGVEGEPTLVKSGVFIPLKDVV
jgi:putative redox protein